MEWLGRWNSAMDYIEGNLDGEISYEEAARIAVCSSYHFQRLFSYIAGVPLGEYIRRRRLTRAAFDLQQGGIKVIDAALKYGYESPEAFGRAFKSLHGIAPAAARRIGVPLKAYPRITFEISVRGEAQMKYRIKQRGPFRMFGIYADISRDSEVAFRQVPEFFKRCDEEKVPDEINRILGRFSDNHTISALYDYEENTFKYLIGNFLPEGMTVPEKFTVLDVPAATYAIFDVADCNMQDMWRRVWTQWFPASGYETAKGISFEMYYGLADHENVVGEIWLPVAQGKH